MECKDVVELFSGYYDGALSAFKKEAVAKHLLSCKKCGLKYRTYREALAYIKAVSDEVLPESFYTGLDRKLEEAGRPFFVKLLPYFTLKNISVGALGVLLGILIGSLPVRTVPQNSSFESASGKTGYTAVEKDKSTGSMIMKTGNVYKASYDIDKIVNRFDNAGVESFPAKTESTPGPMMRVLHKKYIITVVAGQYDNLVKELNTLGYVMKLPDKKELADLKKLKPTDQIRFELDITEDGK